MKIDFTIVVNNFFNIQSYFLLGLYAGKSTAGKVLCNQAVILHLLNPFFSLRLQKDSFILPRIWLVFSFILIFLMLTLPKIKNWHHHTCASPYRGFVYISWIYQDKLFLLYVWISVICDFLYQIQFKIMYSIFNSIW